MEKSIDYSESKLTTEKASQILRSEGLDVTSDKSTKHIHTMKAYKFEDLPDILGALYLRIENIERILKDYNKQDKVIDNDLLSINEASILLKLSVATIYSKVCRNEIPVNKQGKRLYFYRTELLNWIKSGRIKTISEIQREVEANFKSKQSSK
ncbi:helix-turn-helix domain-containing protein [Pseudomonas shirazensis]